MEQLSRDEWAQRSKEDILDELIRLRHMVRFVDAKLAGFGRDVQCGGFSAVEPGTEGRLPTHLWLLVWLRLFTVGEGKTAERDLCRGASSSQGTEFGRGRAIEVALVVPCWVFLASVVGCLLIWGNWERSQQTMVEQEEEYITNRLMKRLEQLKQEKQMLANEVRGLPPLP